MNRILASSFRRCATSPAISRYSARRLTAAVSESPKPASPAQGQAQTKVQPGASSVPISRNIITALVLLGWVSGVYYYTIFRMQGQVITNISDIVHFKQLCVIIDLVCVRMTSKTSWPWRIIRARLQSLLRSELILPALSFSGVFVSVPFAIRPTSVEASTTIVPKTKTTNSL
jgi:hypothetical protein